MAVFTGKRAVTALSSLFCCAYLPRSRYTLSHLKEGYLWLNSSANCSLFTPNGKPTSLNSVSCTEYQSSGCSKPK